MFYHLLQDESVLHTLVEFARLSIDLFFEEPVIISHSIFISKLILQLLANRISTIR